MENLKIEVEETKTYWQRMKNAFWGDFAIMGAAVLFVSFIQSHNNICLFFFSAIGLFVVVAAVSSDELCACYITSIEIDENNLHLVYKKRDKNYEIKDSLEKFIFKRGYASRVNGGIAMYYLEIIHQDTVLLRQYNKWNWSAGSFDKVVDYLIEQKLISQKSFFGLIEKMIIK